MIDAFDASLASDYGTKQRQLFAAETLTGSRRRANRTMILHQQDRTVLPLDTLRHIALLASNFRQRLGAGQQACASFFHPPRDRKSTRLNSSHGYISYAVFCLKNKTKSHPHIPRMLLIAHMPSHASTVGRI